MPERSPVIPTTRPQSWRAVVRTWLLEPTARRLPRTAEVLDLGCGWGFYFRINPKAVGMDGDPVCVAALAARGFDVRHGDLRERLPFHDGQFRFVIAHDVLEHFSLPDAKAITAEVHRILKPGGTFVVLVPNRKGFDFGLRTGAGHVTYVTRREIDEIIAGSFELERAYPEPLPRWLGSHSAHNKEVFLLRKSAGS